jgi:peptidoglycan-N-acetylglucosamine deacetylase
MHSQVRQVLSDPTGRRIVIVNLLGALVVAAILLGIAAISYGLYVAPVLPRWEFTVARKSSLSGGGIPNPHAGGAVSGTLGSRILPSSAVSTTRFAFFGDSDGGAFDALQKHASDLDGLLPEWLEIAASDGGLMPVKRGELRVRDWVQSNARHLGVFPVLSSRRSASETLGVLTQRASRARLVSTLADYLAVNSDQGLAISLPNLPPSGRSTFTQFVHELVRVLRPEGRKIIVVVDAGADEHWVQELTRVADYLLVTLYNQPPDGRGPLAAQGWVEARAAALRRLVPSPKLILGVGSFASDFGAGGGAKLISVQRAWDLMRDAGAQLTVDPAALTARFRYFDNPGHAHDVWLLDGVTMFNHLRGILLHQPAGIAVWRLGLEDPGIWASFAKGRLPDNAALSNLESVEPGYRGMSEIPELIWTVHERKLGKRHLVYSARLGLITQQSLEAPETAVLTEIGKQDGKLIALTFDDGPHATVTPKILDILAQKSVKGTFFVVGRNAMQNPAVLRRVHAEGHDIGNHTYSHADLNDLSLGELALELNATQRILEAELGIHTVLFRPPFNGTSSFGEPSTPKVIEAASGLGYVTVLSGVDSADWLNPPADILVARVIGKVVAGRGQVVLFHDWGKRQPTIDALPLIIDGLAARGYRFVPMHELIGRTREEVMPRVFATSLVSQTALDIRTSTLHALGWLGRALPLIAILGSILCICRLVFVILSVRNHRRLEAARETLAGWPKSVAVILPAYNEEAVICKTVRSVLLPDRRDYEIIVVDDGSSDRTADVVREAFVDDPRVRVFKKANGGKAAAANFALARTEAEIIVSIDADTVLAPDAIPLLVRHFADPAVGAVAGTAVVGNRVNLLTRMQSLEYAIGQSLDRRAFALYNANGIVPGAIGAWRREALLKVGGYASDTVAEDADITFSVIRAGWKVQYEPRAIARTEAPETWRGFLKQRYRWMFGMLQVISKHRGTTLRGTALGSLTIPNVVVFQFGFSILVPILDVLCIWEFSQALWQWVHPDDAVSAWGMAAYAKWWLLFQAIDLLVMAGALRFGGMKGTLRLIPLLLTQRVCYWPLIYWTALSTLLAAAKGRVVGWNKLARTGSVSHDTAVVRSAT